MLRQKVNEAVEKAQQAVALDSEGEIPQAVALYKEAVELITAELDFVPASHLEILKRYAETYSNRVDVLEAQVNAAQEVSDSYNPADFSAFEADSQNVTEAAPKVAYKSTNIPVFFNEDAPNEQVPVFSVRGTGSKGSEKAVAVMKSIGNSIKNGAYLTPNLYLPKYVWYQDGCKLPGLPIKIACCEGLNDGLVRLQVANTGDTDQMQKELETFCAQLFLIQGTLSKLVQQDMKPEEEKKETSHARFSHSLSKLGKTLGKGVAKLGGGSSHTKVTQDQVRYILLVSTVCENAQFLDEWTTTVCADERLHGLMDRIGDFFSSHFCGFVFRDVLLLIDRYMRTARKNFSRLEPKSGAV